MRIRCLQWQHEAHRRAAARVAGDGQRTANFARTLGHAEQTDGAASGLIGVDAMAVVPHAHLELSADQSELDADLARTGMARNIGQGLLEDPVTVRGPFRRDRRVAAFDVERGGNIVAYAEGLECFAQGRAQPLRVEYR